MTPRLHYCLSPAHARRDAHIPWFFSERPARYCPLHEKPRARVVDGQLVPIPRSFSGVRNP
jgi:hypothetical protein